MGSLEGLGGAGCHPVELWLLAQGPAKFCFWGRELNWQMCASHNQLVLLSHSLGCTGIHSPAVSLCLTIYQLGLWPCLSLGSQFPGVFPFLQLQLHPRQMGKLC